MSGVVIWFTGLSGAGKTTLASQTAKRLKELGYDPVFLDGDDLRRALRISNHLDFDNRKELSFCYSNLCKYLAEQGFLVIISTISMFEEVYVYNRKALPNYFEIFLDVPISTLKSRDPKNIYSRFEKNEISNVAGLDLIVERPALSDLVIKPKSNDTPKQTFDLMIPKVLKHIKSIIG